MTNATVKPGQTMLLAKRKSYGDRGWHLRDITVTKVGAKYAYFGSNERFSLETMRVDPWDTTLVYPDRAAFEAAQDRTRKWDALHRWVARNWAVPGHVTAQMIEQAAAALQVELSEVKS